MKRVIKAKSLTEAAQDWIEHADHIQILHIFDDAANLVDQSGNVLSIVNPHIGDGPFNLVLEETILFTNYVRIETIPIIQKEKILLGELIIDVRRAYRWDPYPDWKKLHASRHEVFKRFYSTEEVNIQSSVPEAILSQFFSSAATTDIAKIKRSVKKIAGLGIGLTPSGDDIIMGALFAVRIVHPPDVANVIANEMVKVASPATTSLSAAWIRSAGTGQAGIHWHVLFAALLSGQELETPLAKIAAIGETSGMDAITGFLGVIFAFNERIMG